MKHETIAQVPGGQVFMCGCCQSYHLEYGNIHMALPIEDLYRLWEMLAEFDPGYYEQTNQSNAFRRKVMIPLPKTNIDFVFSAEEVLELRGLLQVAIDRAVLPASEQIDSAGSGKCFFAPKVRQNKLYKTG